MQISDENKHFNPENTNFIKICNYYDKRITFTEVFGIEHHRSEYAIMEQFGEDRSSLGKIFTAKLPHGYFAKDVA